MRGISQQFVDDLKCGTLSGFLKRMKTDSSLSMQIRKDYINIYYRGGNLLKITQNKKLNTYTFQFDLKYCLNKENQTLISSLSNKSPQNYLDNLELMKKEMDNWFSIYPKTEREHQQLLCENNNSVVDIEYQFKKSMRLDMLMVENDKLIIVENKYGYKAISGKAGIKKHYYDICQVISNKDLINELADSVISISKIKRELGLNTPKIENIDLSKTEILFLLVNYEKNSINLKTEISNITKLHNAKLIMLEGYETKIDYSQAKDLFSYES